MKQLLFISILALASSCSTTQIYCDMDQGVAFSKYKTFAWLQHSDSVHNHIYDNQLVDQNIHTYTNREMAARGYKVDTKEPDLLIEYHTMVQHEHQTISNPVYSNPSYNYNPAFNYGGMGGGYYGQNMGMGGYGYNPGYNYGYNNVPYIIGYRNQTVDYDEGTLIIDIIDRRANRMIWRCWSVGTVTNTQQVENELPKDIKRIFSKYPIRPLSTSAPETY